MVPTGSTGRRIGWALSALASAVWLVVVTSADLWARVLGHWESALTMLFGSFLAGSSPEGGGAVAFPVFTKALEVPAPAARTFGLSIQAVGMTMAAIAIVLNRRPIHRRSLLIGVAVAVPAFLLAAFGLGSADEAFRPSVVPTAWVKATFSIVLATTSILMVRHLRHEPGEHRYRGWSPRLDLGVAIVAAAGGLLSALTGTGANILIFLFLVVLADVAPKTALPTAISVMAAVSIVGFVVFGLVDGHLDIELLSASGAEGAATGDDRVVSVGGIPVDLAAGRADLFGLWLAAVPVVVWGAPLGSLAASLVDERHLVRFVALLAAVEVVSTFVLVGELRTEPALVAYLVVGLVVLPAVFIMLRRHRLRVFDPAGIQSVVEPASMPR